MVDGYWDQPVLLGILMIREYGAGDREKGIDGNGVEPATCLTEPFGKGLAAHNGFVVFEEIRRLVCEEALDPRCPPPDSGNTARDVCVVIDITFKVFEEGAQAQNCQCMIMCRSAPTFLGRLDD